jgi:hypothetical protein
LPFRHRLFIPVDTNAPNIVLTVGANAIIIVFLDKFAVFA